MSSVVHRDALSNIVSLDEHRVLIEAKQSSVVSESEHHVDAEEMSFKLIDFLQKMVFRASLEVDDLPWIRSQFSPRVRDQVVASVKKILWQEFGKNRVWRRGLMFEIQHRNIDPLIASLLRVQFYTNQILLPEYNVFGERIDQNGVSITWGVGRDNTEAQQERLKKRQQKNLRC